MTRTIHRERIPSTDPRLRRHIHHDSESRRYAYDTRGLTLVSAKHERKIPVLDQGQLGSCTGNAGIGCLGTSPFFETVSGPGSGDIYRGRTWYDLDENGAVALYSAATAADDYPGQYPPTDTGSDGLSIAKVLTKAGEIAGYQHTFTLADALLALTKTPVIVGMAWHQDMFTPDADGRVHPTGDVAGGHEICVDEIDADNREVWFTNSWGTSWGMGGRAYLTFDDFGALLADQGDVTIFTPLTAPAPTPTPPAPAPADDADQALAAVARPWVAERHTDIAHNSEMKAGLKTWLTAKGL
jgi:hypothetical protein